MSLITNPDNVSYGDEYIEWYNGTVMDLDELDDYLADAVESGNIWSLGADFQKASNNTDLNFRQIENGVAGIFGMPYQFSKIVDVPIQKMDGKSISQYRKKENTYLYNVGRKYAQKILANMPVIFLTPGEPKFMAGYNKKSRANAVQSLAAALNGGLRGDDDDNGDLDDGRYYSFSSDFTSYKKYANTALRTLAFYMGIQDVIVPIPGMDPDGNEKSDVKLRNLDIEDFLVTPFVKRFGNQALPFYLDANTSISEDYTNSTTESMISQTANGFSQNARELKFIMGNHNKSLLGDIGNALLEAGTNVISGMGDIASAATGTNMLSRISNELLTVVSGGKIVFPEIWSESEYSPSYSITLKLRSPDPDPVSIFLNIYMPIILLISMAAPRQIGNSSTSYTNPYLVRATYKSIFNLDLGIIQSLSITRGGEGNWNVMGQPTAADVEVTLKDLYSTMFISKRMGIISNTAQMDYLSTLAGLDLNDFEPTRLAKLYTIILGNTVRDWSSDMWGGVKRFVGQKAASVLSTVSDTRYLG